MARVTINMLQTEHQHSYDAIPAKHPEHNVIHAIGAPGMDCKVNHAGHQYCISDVVEYHPLNWQVADGSTTLYGTKQTTTYDNQDSTITEVAIHQPRTHRHYFLIPYPIEAEYNGVHVDVFDPWGFSGGCGYTLPRDVVSGCFFVATSATIRDKNYYWSSAVALVYKDTTGAVVCIGDHRADHFHYYKCLVGVYTYPAGGTYRKLVKCVQQHEKCFWGLATDNEEPDGSGNLLYTSLPLYSPPPSAAIPYPPAPAYDQYYLDRATGLGVA